MKVHSSAQELVVSGDLMPVVGSDEVEVCALGSGPMSNRPSICVAENLEPEKIIENILHHRLKHLVQKNENYFYEELATTAKFLISPASFFESISNVVLGEARKTKVEKFFGGKDKSHAKSSLLEFAEAVSGRGVGESVEAIFEELFMNAVLDAPAQAQKLGFTLPPERERASQMEISYNESLLLLSCKDPYGSMNIDKFVSRMQEVYRYGAGNVINYAEGGAGLGCVLMFENCLSLYLGVEKARQTMVACTIPLGLSNKVRQNLKKSFHRIEI